jgi:hypothetical protein
MFDSWVTQAPLARGKGVPTGRVNLMHPKLHGPEIVPESDGGRVQNEEEYP